MITNGYPYRPHFQHIHPHYFTYDQRTSRPYTVYYPYPHCFYFHASPDREVYPYGEGYAAQPQQFESTRLESTSQGFNIKLNNSQENEENASLQENQSENAQGFHMDTGGEIGGKHGVGFHADGHIDEHGVSTQASSHLGEEKYGLGVHGKAGLNGSKGLNFDTGGQLGGKYGLGGHADGHLSLSQGMGVNTEAQIGGNHGLGAHVNGLIGGKKAEFSTGATLGGDHGLGVHAKAQMEMGANQGASLNTKAQIGGDHGLGAHANAQFSGSNGINFKIGGNIGSHDGALGINIGGKDK